MKSENYFLKKFKAIFEETPYDNIFLNTIFKELIYWDSISILSLIVLFEEEYDKKITINDINNCATVEDLYKLTLVSTK